MISRYDYKKLREKALSATATQEDIDNLGKWFELFGETYWNGEYYDADGAEIWPVYKKISEDDFELVGYEIR